MFYVFGAAEALVSVCHETGERVDYFEKENFFGQSETEVLIVDEISVNRVRKD